MKISIRHLLFIIAIVSSALTYSCVSKKKLIASEAKVSQLKKDNTTMHNRLNECNLEVVKLNEDKALLQNENMMAARNLKVLSISLKTGQVKHLQKFQGMIQLNKDLMTALKSSMSDALVGYSADELSVSTKDESICVSLNEGLLFESGSDIVDAKGKDALNAIATVLNTTNNITVLVENHADNTFINNDLFKDSWDLSTARATSIVRIFVNDYGFDNRRITVSGGGDLQPISATDTEAGIANNCHTDIILSPDVNELYKFLE